MTCCVIGSFLYIYWLFKFSKSHEYLSLKKESFIVDFIIRFFNWLLIFGNFVPISLVVTVETVKFAQAKLLNQSPDLTDFRGELG